MRIHLQLFAACIVLASLSSRGLAQPSRYELGRRLRTFEEQWDKVSDNDARKRTVAPLQRAIAAFFTFRFGPAAHAIDDARFALDPDATPTPAGRWATSLALFPAARLLECDATELGFECKAFYDVPRPANAKSSLRVTLIANGKAVALRSMDIDALPAKSFLPLKEVPEGDHSLRYEFLDGEATLAQGTIRISFIPRLEQRLSKLKKFDAIAPAGSDRATIAATVRLLEKLRAGGVEETDYPASRLLRDAEAAREAIVDRKLYYTRERTGQHWLSLVLRSDPKAADRVVPLRILVPPQGDGKAPPLVVALHGAGGSENLFFDGYGHGKIVRLCEERGWILVAPRVGFGLPLAKILDELHGRFAFDAGRVFVVGHSMGAATAVQAVSAEPGRYAAVAALGGSGAFQPSQDLKRVPFFVAAGAQDFGLRGADSLRKRLVAAGVEKVVWSELENVEHLGIVQQALPEAFRFFDEIAREKVRKRPTP